MLIRDKLLSKRLQVIYDLVDQNDSVADIGTDHGYLIAALIKDNKISKAYGVDNKTAPLSQAQKTMQQLNIHDEVELTLVSDDHPYHHVDVWVIAGMGYETIASICNEFMETIKKLKYVIIQANHQVDRLRAYCVEHNLHIVDEKIVVDNFYYQIIKVTYKEQSYHLNDLQLLCGPLLLENKEQTFINYCEHKISSYKQLLMQVPKNSDRAKEIQHMIHQYNTALLP